MVVRADGSQAAAAGDELTRSLGGVARAERDAANAAGQLGTATDSASTKARSAASNFAAQSAAARANADAINQVIRATNPAVSTQAQLDAALRRVQSAYIAGKVGAETYARAQAIATRATAENVAWQQRATSSAGQMRAGTMMLGQQIQDIGMQLALGTGFLRTMAMQAGQTALAVQQMGGAGSRFATFIGGPWGSLILAGVSVLALLGTTAIGTATSVKSLSDDLVRNAREAAANREAQRIFANTLESVTEAVRENREALQQLERGHITEAQRVLETAVSQQVYARSVRAATQALLEQRLAEFEIARDISAGAGDSGLAVLSQAETSLREQIAALGQANANLTELERQVREATSRRATEIGDRLADPIERIRERYDNPQRGLIELERRRLVATRATTEEIIRQTRALAAQRDAEVERAQAARRTPRTPSDGVSRFRSREDAIGVAGRELQGLGFGVSENNQFGGVHARHTYAAHGRFAADVNIGTGNVEADDPGMRERVEAAVRSYQARGYRILWNGRIYLPLGNGPGPVIPAGRGVGQHRDHFHIEAPGSIVGRPRGSVGDLRQEMTAAREADRLQEFGSDARNRIAGITDRFQDQPRLLEQVRGALAQIDDLVEDIERRRPPNWQALVAQATAAKEVIRESVNGPYRQLIESQGQQLAVQRLISAGRDDEAAALQIITRLEAQGVPLSTARKDAILAGVQALREEQRQLEVNRQRQQAYISALGDVRSIILDTIESGFRNIGDIPRRLQQTFSRLGAEYIFESLFGNTFRRLEAQIRGENSAEGAAERFRVAVGRAEDATGRTVTALDRLATSADRAASAVGSTSAGVTGAIGDPTTARNALAELFGVPAGGMAWGTGRAASADEDGTITVTGRRPAMGGIPTNPRDFMGHILGQLAEGILGRDAARTIGGVVSKGLEGAAIGGASSGIARAVGIKQSNTGASIGGALGNFIPGLPPGVGAAIGGIIGGTIGGLLKKTPKASVSLTNAYDDFSATGSRSLTGAATGAGGSVQSGLQSIAEQLGATLGSFAVSIGIRDGKYRVDPTGKGATKTKKGAVDFGDDEGAAVAYAIRNAIADGAVQGLSAAVSRALSSSTDIDRAVREALKVQELEDLLGGVGGSLGREFKNFDKLAAERVRLATKYGLDLLAVERINGEERAKLVKQITADRIGSAMQFLKDMQFGDLFEGDAPTRRGLILDEIAATQKEAEAGIDGAADRLVDLYRRLIDTSKEAYGTAGPELATDREAAKTGVERVIELENQRLAIAQGLQQATVDALAAGNTLANETNGLLAIANNTLAQIAAGMSPVGGGGGGGGYGGGASRFSDINLV